MGFLQSGRETGLNSHYIVSKWGFTEMRSVDGKLLRETSDVRGMLDPTAYQESC